MTTEVPSAGAAPDAERPGGGRALPAEDDRARTTVAPTSRLDFTIVTLRAIIDNAESGPILTEAIPGLERLPMLGMLQNMTFARVLDPAADELGPGAVNALRERLGAL